jgi:hypothetical protein
MKKLLRLLVVLSFTNPIVIMAQKTCTSNPPTLGSNINFGSIAWTAGGGATVAECNNMADGISTFTGNVIVDLANGTIVTVTNNVNITGNFPISGGNGSVFSVTGGFTFHVTGDMGNTANNDVEYNAATVNDKIIVDGTLYGKNNTDFTGSGKITGGALDVKNGTTCSTPCPVTGGFASCTSATTFCTTAGVVLPIVLLDFSAVPNAESIHVKWTTVLEENFEKFIVQRSQDGLEFHEIAVIQGAGRNLYGIKTNYSFEDNSPLVGYNYYRLKAVDWDGRFEIFGVKAVKLNKAKHLSIYPNPSSGNSFFVETNFNPSDGDQILITNNLGIQLYQTEPREVNNQITLPSTLSPGIYFVKYISKEYTDISRVMVK